MTRQLELALSRTGDPDTSVDAAASVNVNQLENECLRALGAVGSDGLTTEECATIIGRELGSVTPRFRPLETKGFICRTRDRRKGRSGSTRIVWCLKAYSE